MNLSHSKKKDISNRPVYDAMWFKEEILNTFGISISPEEVGYEAVLLEHDEIDEDIISKEELQSLPNPLLAYSFIYTNSTGDEWLFFFVIREQDGALLYKAWFKNNQKIDPTGR